MRETDVHSPGQNGAATKTSPLLLAVSWLWVGIPLAWGLYETLQKSVVLFK